MKKYIIGILLLLVVGTIVVLIPTIPQHSSVTTTKEGERYYNTVTPTPTDELLPDDLNSILDPTETVPLDTNPISLTVLVNRSYPLPSTYIPANLTEPDVPFAFGFVPEKRQMQRVAAMALEEMFTAAKSDGILLAGVSGYRSYVRQAQIYQNNVNTRGVAATNSVSAKPGTSEHQTGLAIDISAKSVAYGLAQSFGSTKEGKWVAKHAHTYGFIVRYPKGKQKMTGYSYEPWHIRYLGKTVATYLYQNKLSLEEYYGCSPDTTTTDTDTSSSVDVEDADKVKLETPAPTKKPTPTKSPKKTPAPTKTEKPKKTPKPTKEPVTTKKPAKTPSPTKAPSATEKPTKTEVPETE